MSTRQPGAVTQAVGGRYVLDISALLSLHNDEPGSVRVEQLLLATVDGQAEVFGCFMSLADAWIAATTIACDATLVHKDPEFQKVHGMAQERLPYK